MYTGASYYVLKTCEEEDTLSCTREQVTMYLRSNLSYALEGALQRALKCAFFFW